MSNFKFKKILLILLIMQLFIAANSSYIFAQTATAKPTDKSGEKLIDEINNLREKVASKVAELNLVEKRGIMLSVTDVAGNKITGNDFNNETRIIDVDELTNFASPSSKTFGISDINKGSLVSVVGLYNKQSKRILARFIATKTNPEFISGIITEIDKANFTITVKSEDKENTVIDIDNITKTSSYTKDEGIKKLGFSKLELLNRVLVTGYRNIDEQDRISATRVLAFPEAAKNPNIDVDRSSSDSSANSTPVPTTKITSTENN